MTIWSKSNIILWDIQVKLIELKIILTEEHCDPHCIAMHTCQKILCTRGIGAHCYNTEKWCVFQCKCKMQCGQCAIWGRPGVYRLDVCGNECLYQDVITSCLMF